MTRASDAMLVELARSAGVRVTVVFHAMHYRRELKDRFSVEGYCAFTGLPEAQAERVFAVLDTIPARQRKVAQRASKSLLPEEWTMPEDWLVMGRERRFWTMDVCRTEADKFHNWHRAKGTMYADWKAAWRNWIDGSHRENGNAVAGKVWTEEDRVEGIAKTIALYRKMGRHEEADALERG